MNVDNTNNTKPIVPPKPAALSKAPQLSTGGVNLPAGVPSLGKVVNVEDTYVLPAGVSDLGAVVPDEAPAAAAASVTPEAPKSAGKGQALKSIKNFAASTLNRAKSAGIATVAAILVALDTGLNKVSDAVKSVVALISAAIKTGLSYAKSGVSSLVSLVSSKTKTKESTAAQKSANKILAANLNSIKKAGKGTLASIFIAIDTGLNKTTSAVSSLSSANKGDKA